MPLLVDGLCVLETVCSYKGVQQFTKDDNACRLYAEAEVPVCGAKTWHSSLLPPEHAHASVLSENGAYSELTQLEQGAADARHMLNCMPLLSVSSQGDCLPEQHIIQDEMFGTGVLEQDTVHANLIPQSLASAEAPAVLDSQPILNSLCQQVLVQQHVLLEKVVTILNILTNQGLLRGNEFSKSCDTSDAISHLETPETTEKTHSRVHSTEILLRNMEHKSEHCHLAVDTVYCAILNLMVKRKKNSIVQAQRRKQEFLAQQKNDKIESHVRAIIAMYECNAEKERPAPVSTTCAHATWDQKLQASIPATLPHLTICAEKAMRTKHKNASLFVYMQHFQDLQLRKSRAALVKDPVSIQKQT